DPGLSFEQRHLAEEGAGTENADAHPVTGGLDLARDNDEELSTDLAFASEHLARGELHRRRLRRDHRQLLPGAPLEQPDVAEQLDTRILPHAPPPESLPKPPILHGGEGGGGLSPHRPHGVCCARVRWTRAVAHETGVALNEW